MRHPNKCDTCGEIFYVGCFDNIKRYEYKVETDVVKVGERFIELAMSKLDKVECNTCLGLEDPYK